MFLNPDQYYKSTNMRTIILQHTSTLEMHPFRCKKCHGSGLKDHHRNNNQKDYNWSGEYCEECCGVGFDSIVQKEYLKRLGLSMCVPCNGVGCPKCNQKGFVDWVEKVVGNKFDKDEKYSFP